MSSETFHVTGEDVRTLESKEGKAHGGEISKDSDAAILKSIIAERNPEEERIENARKSLPLPEDPLDGKAPPPEGNSADARTTGIGSGSVNVKLGTESSSGLREPATADSAVRTDGEALKKNTV